MGIALLSLLLYTLIKSHPRVTLVHVVSSVAILSTLAVTVVAVAAAESDGGDAWGTLFLASPAIAGMTMALVTRGDRASVLAGIGVMGIVLASGLLILSGLEGILCCLMAMPIVGAGFAIGSAAGLLLRWAFHAFVSRRKKHDLLMRSVTAAVLLAAMPNVKSAERARVSGPRVEPIASTITIAAPPALVWSALEEIDAIHGPKPFLMRIGLPVPTMCRMDGDGVGAKRTCYFENGYIQERVSLWDPPRRMELEIVHWTLPGRHWLGYQSASYELAPTPDGEATVVTRTTTITSNLRPAWYWRPLEGLGVRTEHDYLLRDVRQRIEQPET